MKNRIYRALIVTLAMISLGAVIRSPRGPWAAGDDSYSGLVGLFKDFRDFLKPRIVLPFLRRRNSLVLWDG